MHLPYLLYVGPGTENNALARIRKFLARSGYAHDLLIAKSAEAVVDHLRRKSVSLLIMPGGRDLPYVRAFRGEPNRLIRQFVYQGGGYLGICAGAYYGCREVIFEEGGPLEVLGSRELCFFPAAAVGPAYGLRTFHYEKPLGAVAAQLDQSLSVYYNGGCYFHNAHLFPGHVEVFAHYQDIPETPAAVVGCRIGKGKALLCGVHPEMEPEDVPAETPHYEQVKQQLKNSHIQRAETFKQWLSWLHKIC